MHDIRLSPARRFAMAFLWLCLLALPQAQADVPAARPAPGIAGHDDRVPLDSTEWPWRAVGRVNQGNGAYCTGTLIAPDAVLTAAHCLLSRYTGRFLDPHGVIFVAGLRRDKNAGFARGRAIRHAPSFAGLQASGITVDNIAQDWAVLELEHPLPIRPIAVHPLPAGDGMRPGERISLQRAGYGRDRPYLLSLHDGCSIRERLADDRVLFTDCDTTFGDSGSALLLKQGDDIWVVGVSSAIGARQAKQGSYAVHAAAFIDSLRLKK